MNQKKSQQIYFGAALIVLGTALYFLRSFEGLGRAAIFLLVGGAFLAVYFHRREFGLLVPACLISGLGVGLLGKGAFFEGYHVTLVGLGIGFVAITLIALLYQGRFHAWPLIPGVVLIVLGIPDTNRVLDYALTYWPLILVALGVVILLRAFRRPGRTQPGWILPLAHEV